MPIRQVRGVIEATSLEGGVAAARRDAGAAPVAGRFRIRGIAGVVVLAALFAVGLRYILAQLTGFQADDAWITYRYAENLADGLGFVYNAGERVYGTTTPLLTLLLAALDRIGVAPPHAAFAINLAATAATLVVVALLLRRRIAALPLCLCLGAIALLPTHAEWTVSGLETALFVALLVASFLAYVEGRWRSLGCVGAALILTRFDGIVLLPAIAATELWLLVWARKSGSRDRPGAAPLFAAKGPAITIALLLLCLGPWLVFAAWFFGDVVPNSVWAKLALYNAAGFDRTSPVALAVQALRFGGLLPGAIEMPLAVIAIAGVVLWPNRFAILPIWLLGYLAFLLAGKTHVHPWYVVPMHVVAVICLAVVAHRFHRLLRPHATASAVRDPRWRAMAATALAAAVPAMLAWYSLPTTLARVQQRQQVYLHAHADIGAYLRDHAADEDTVYAWDIGYIGALSGRRILDFVGIVSPEVIAANKRRDFVGVLREHRPRWAVVGLYGNASLPIIDDGWFRSAYEPAYRNEVPWLEPWAVDDPRRLAVYRPEYVVYRLRDGAP